MALVRLSWLGSVDATGVSRKKSIAKEAQMQEGMLISNCYVGMIWGFAGFIRLLDLVFSITSGVRSAVEI
jgi:hypothetical protein